MARFMGTSATTPVLLPSQSPVHEPAGIARWSMNNNSDSMHTPSSGIRHVPETVYHQKDFPKIRWWYKNDWMKHSKQTVHNFTKSCARGGTRAADGVNVRYQFIEEPADGTVVSGYRASEIRARFGEFAIYLYVLKRAPDTWARGLTAQDRVDYDAWMRKTCPELQYCNNNWKAKHIAVTEYPQWKPAYDKRVHAREEKAKCAALEAASGDIKGKFVSDFLDVVPEEDDDSQAAQDERNAPNVAVFLNKAPFSIETESHADEEPGTPTPSSKRTCDSLDPHTDDIQPSSAKQSKQSPSPALASGHADVPPPEFTSTTLPASAVALQSGHAPNAGDNNFAGSAQTSSAISPTTVHVAAVSPASTQPSAHVVAGNSSPAPSTATPVTGTPPMGSQPRVDAPAAITPAPSPPPSTPVPRPIDPSVAIAPAVHLHSTAAVSGRNNASEPDVPDLFDGLQWEKALPVPQTAGKPVKGRLGERRV
ncbi:hypothetical protein TRAPUB_4368 [Trametes pubescens]|uniref:Uncharacterized protein n=1 Tax=Trametes pubescens TaxID=154538 RepID=A0A1M2VBG8_TRAPU|nr:hypothetical protein TRAPUB_4368 [Trametes pubescens]